MKRILAALVAAFAFAAFSTSCAQNPGSTIQSTSPSASEERTASRGTPDAASSAAQSPQVRAASDSSADFVPISDGSGLPCFFLAWTRRLEVLESGDMADRLQVSDGLASLIEQARDWEQHKSGDTVTIELSSQDVVVTAHGTVDMIQSVSAACQVGSPSDGRVITPSLLLFTLSSGALAEVLAGEGEGGMKTLNYSLLTSVHNRLSV